MSKGLAGRAAAEMLLARVEAELGPELARAEEAFQHELRSRSKFVNDVLEHLTQFRGKRLRPILLLLSGKAAGDIADDHIVLAAVVEMIHTATLVHDDVLDEADVRRHVPTINASWNNETSVLLGDYLFTHAFHLASSLESTVACRLIGRATNLVCEGELTQIHERGNDQLTEEQYFEIIEGKTAELCAVCCGLGAQFSKASDDVVDALREYGRLLGIAFQITDDLLDVMGSEEKTGKTLGSDIDKQKLTLPVIRLLAEAAPAEAERIRVLLAHPSPSTMTELKSLLEGSGAIHYSVTRANEFALAARQQLGCLRDSSAKQLLEDLTEFATQRNW